MRPKKCAITTTLWVIIKKSGFTLNEMEAIERFWAELWYGLTSGLKAALLRTHQEVGMGRWVRGLA